MSNENTTYYINEAILTLPGAIESDSTINIIKLDDKGTALIITRGKMGAEDTLEKSIDEQLEKLKKQVKELHYTPKQATKLGINDHVEGIELQNKFLRGNERVFQYQVAFVLPGTQVMMALSYTKMSPLTEADEAQWAALKQQIRFRLPTEVPTDK